MITPRSVNEKSTLIFLKNSQDRPQLVKDFYIKVVDHVIDNLNCGKAAGTDSILSDFNIFICMKL